METKDIIVELRTKKGLSQESLAEKVFVTRQAVSRWENGETVPNTETLKLLSKLFDVSINTLLGSPRQLICQCCGMPLEDSNISKETDGFFNEEYCKWCYADGEYMYHDMDDLIETCVKHMASDDRISVYRSEPFFIELMPKGVDKASSIDRMLSTVGLTRENTICCGDGYNDLTMIEYAGVGVAMANAQEKVKEKADYITKSNDEDGIVQVIDEFIL